MDEYRAYRERRLPQMTIKELKAEIGAIQLGRQMRADNIFQLEAAIQALRDRDVEDQEFERKVRKALKTHES